MEERFQEDLQDSMGDLIRVVVPNDEGIEEGVRRDTVEVNFYTTSDNDPFFMTFDTPEVFDKFLAALQRAGSVAFPLRFDPAFRG